MTDRLEDRFAEFAKVYKNERYKLWHLVGQNFGSGFKRFFVPFRDFDESHVISIDSGKTRSSLLALRSKLDLCDEEQIRKLRLISLTAKRRAELMGAKSDFYPVYSALLGVCLAVLGIYAPNDGLRMMAAGGVIFFVATSAVIRMMTREQVAYLKELAYLVDHVLTHRANDDDGLPPNN
ncbi:hypothetical protein [Xanthomonas euvesicatoria]|uniref:hypothetical protein n=1 Tax=Xanthomonas euvesicatoria TaxID=456327 RepID=UPI001C43E1D7|nr:hypothetical protein [Xanthomonas euvesicatoria]MBV6790077.1 hypothetical protein [Xanthomonas campestris pv. clerodendri]